MPPETEEEFAAEAALDAKLGAFFEAETAEQPTDTAEQAPVEEAAEEAASDERPRDEKGRFAPQDEETPAEQAERLLAGKYKTAEELEEAYKQLQSRLGSQGQELGELRKQFEESLDKRFGEFQQAQAQTQFATAAPGLIQNLVDEGRYQDAAAYAVQSQNGVLYGQVMNEWMAVEPYNAYSYDNHLRSAQLARQVQESTAPLMQSAEQQRIQHELSTAIDSFARDKPDLQQVGPEMMKVAEESPRVLGLLQDPSPEARMEVLDYLYTKARARIGDTLATRAADAAAEADEQARQAKTQATVGVTGTAPTQTPKTNVDEWRQQFRQVLFDDSNSIRSGLTTD